MKIFVSSEGVHGWANRLASEKRLDVLILNLDTTVSRTERKGDGQQIALIIDHTGKNAPPQLRPLENVQKSIIRVTGNLHGQPVESKGWRGDKTHPGMVSIIAFADQGSTISAEVVDAPGAAFKTYDFKLNDLPWYTAVFVHAVNILPDDPTQALLWIVVFFIALCVIGSIFRYWQQFLGMTVANRVVMDLRRRMYDRVVQLPTSYFAQKGTSDVMSRLTQDTSILTDGVSMALGKAIQEPIKAFFAFSLALWIDWKLCLAVVITMPILGLIIRKFSKRMRRASRGALENSSRMLSIINETLIGLRVVKAYSAEGYERRRFAHINKKLLKEQTKLNHYSSLSRPTIETLAVVLSSIPMVVAAHFVLRGSLGREEFIVLLACFAAMIEPMRKLADVNSKVQQSNAAGTRVFEVIDMPAEPNHDHSLPKLPRHQRTIEFRNICFNYPGHEEQVLKNISLTVNHGQNIAVVGGNGSGKTTLLQLLPRLYVPTTGIILVDGYDIANVSLRSLRSQIGLVTQDTVLFADSIFNNISYGNRHVTREQVLDASRRAYADEFIKNLPQGYDTLVGEHGVRLSGGQKQRLAIARAILHDPTILILDEAMSQIDSDSEMKITLALREFTKNRTTLMIAHRFQTVISADSIICLDKGLVVGAGTHSQLLESCIPYHKLYENQFRDAG